MRRYGWNGTRPQIEIELPKVYLDSAWCLEWGRYEVIG